MSRGCWQGAAGRGLECSCTWRDRPQQESTHRISHHPLSTWTVSLLCGALRVWDLRNSSLGFVLTLRIYFIDFNLFIL